MLTRRQILDYTHAYIDVWDGSYPAHADLDGAVFVLDPVAGYFTRHHPLTVPQQQYVRDAAWRARAKALTARRINVLRDEAGQHGDTEQVALCDRAMAGDVSAREECARIIARIPLD